MNWSNYDDVLGQLRAIGLVIDGPLELAVGKKSVRCTVDGEGTEKRGWYRLHEWQIEPGVLLLIGSFGIFRGSASTTFKVELSKRCDGCGAEVSIRAKECQACGKKTFAKRELSQEQKEIFRQRQEEDRKRALAESAAESARTSQWATAVWRACSNIDSSGHAYLQRKHLSGSGGARVFPGIDGLQLQDAEADDYRYLATFAGHLVVPFCDGDGKIHGLQFIADKPNPKTGRDKTFWPRGMTAEGHYWLIGGSPRRLCLLAEGFATAMTLHAATGHPVAVMFSATNALPVARQIDYRTRGRANLLMCADDDWLQRCQECKTYTPVDVPTCAHCGKPHRQKNAGLLRCIEVALALDNAAEFRPVFSISRPSDRKGLTDFNDLATLEGIQVVTAQFEQRIAALEWQAAATTPAPATALPSRTAGEQSGGGGGQERPPAQAVMPFDAAVDRFVPLDDGTGDLLFDSWTNKVVKRAQMIAILPAGIRWDDVKRHDVWLQRGACYLDQVGFDPTEKDKTIKLNTWQGWPMQPVEGSCSELLDLLEYLCSKEPNAAEVYRWVLQWMAYPLQHPGAKMSSAIIMHGPQGTGKSTVFQALSKIYGDYATVLNQRGLEDKFNADWSDSKLFILAEEVVTRAEMWHIKNELKELVTGEWIRINPKNIGAYRQRNQLNICYLSNDNQPLPIENDDRRHLVIYTPPQLSEEYYDRVHLEIERGGIEAFYHYLLYQVDCSGFHSKKRPPMTTAKQSLIDLSLPSEFRFINDWIGGDLDLPVCPCLATDLYATYLRWCRTNGEQRPRASNHFFNPVSRLPGWTKKKCRIYPNEEATSTVPKEMVIPGPDVLKKSGHAQPETVGPVQWLTGCARRFSAAIRPDAGVDR